MFFNFFSLNKRFVECRVWSNGCCWFHNISVTPPAASTPNSPYTPAPAMTTAVTPPGQSEQRQSLNSLYNSFLTVVLFVIISLYITQPKHHHLTAILRVAYVPTLRTDPIDLIGREQMDQPDQPTLDHPLITPLVMVLIHSAFYWFSF